MEKNTARQIDFEDVLAFSCKQQYHTGLRPYQQKNKAEIYKAWGEGKMSIMLQMPTGTGKTHLFSSLIKDLQDYFYSRIISRGQKSYEDMQKYRLPRILVLVHRVELVEQIEETLTSRYKHVCGTVTGGKVFAPDRKVIVASVQTLSRRKRLTAWEQDSDFDFIIIDEAHHSTADSYQRIRSTWPNARLLGVTATPYRLNHQPFTDTYDHLILSKPVYRFIEEGYLCNYEYYSIRPDSKMQYSIDHLKTDFSGDFDEREMELLLNEDHIRAGILQTYETFAKGKKGIVYTINRLHNQMLSDLFKKHGYSVAYIDSQTPKEERAATVKDFREGKVQIIFNVNIFSEGFDCPDVEFIQLARPTKSLSMYLQQVGRGFRIHKGKQKVIFLDNVGLYNRFGLPSARRHWQHHFEGREDWEEDSHSTGNPLEEHEYHPSNLSEGNEEIMMVYSSFPKSETETDLTIQETEEMETIQTTEPTDNSSEMIIKYKDKSYPIDVINEDQRMQLLCLIEDVRHTGLIDIDGLKANIEQNSMSIKKQKLLEFLSTNDVSAEDVLALLHNDRSALPATAESVNLHGGLFVKTRAGQIIQERSDAATMVEAIKQAGVEQVYNLKIPMLNSFLVTTELHSNPRYRSTQLRHKVGKYYVNTHSDTLRKQSELEEISKRLELGWIVGVASNETVDESILSIQDMGKKREQDQSTAMQENTHRKGLYVITHSGKRIQRGTDAQTFLDAIEEAGVERVYNLHIKRLGTELITKTNEINTINPIYHKRLYPIGNGEYQLLINFSNQAKVVLLNKISADLHLGWTMGIEN